MLKRSSLLPVIILLSGCGTLGGSSDPIILTRCPPLATYTQAEREQAANEIDAMPPNAVTPQMLADYVTLRDQCRAILR